VFIAIGFSKDWPNVFELWIPLTIAGAFFQNLRSALQKHLKAKLSTGGASYVRFLYALPFALLYCGGLVMFGDYPLPTLNATFLIYCFLGGLSQILFTFLLVYLFTFRSFAVGTTYSKTETIQVALLGLILLGDRLSIPAAIAIAISLFGVMILSAAQSKITLKTLISGLFEKQTVIGLICGAFLGASVVFFRGAALALGDGDFIMRAAFALAIALIMQTIGMGIYLRLREPGQLTKVIRNWPPALAVGVAGILASICWFTAFTLQNAAYVRALGQIELIFTFIASVIFFKEKSSRLEVIGILLIAAAILILLFSK
jgi:drug/metabolite transporter (DMT)-like permease